MRLALCLLTLLFSSYTFAGVYKCIDNNDRITYQNQPCAEQALASEIDLTSGANISLEEERRRIQLAREKREQEEIAQRKIAEQQARLLQESIAETRINQQFIKDHPKQFSAFAIPPYTEGDRPALVEDFQARLPEIERLRRKAALYVLDGGNCGRVEASELNSRSSSDNLVFLVDCSSGLQTYVEEKQLSSR